MIELPKNAQKYVTRFERDTGLTMVFTLQIWNMKVTATPVDFKTRKHWDTYTMKYPVKVSLLRELMCYIRESIDLSRGHDLI